MNTTKFPNLNFLWANLIIEELVRNGVVSFCISSGSRSSALTLAAASNPKAKSYIHFDERGSAFRALGIVSSSKKPCAVITTSGTAAANVFPAVIEASKKKIPLIVLTADRPPELRFTGAHQTIDQTKIYGEHVRWYFDLPCPTLEIAPEFVLTTIDQAVARATGNLKGPVHLNCMYREPLAPVQSKPPLSPSYTKWIQSWASGTCAYTSYKTPVARLQSSDIDEIENKLGKIKSGIIVVGKLSTSREQKSLLKLADLLNWPVFADISSGLRLGNDQKCNIHYFDQILFSGHMKKMIQPDGVLHIGGRITSKRWYEYIGAAQPQQYIMVLNHPLRNDPLHNVTTRIQCDIVFLMESLIKRLPQRNNKKTLSLLKKCDVCVHETLNAFFAGQGHLSEPQTARSISEHIPSHSGLFVSSSMPIREMDMYSNPHKNAVVFGSNRGASGIDGTIATAAGFATGLNKRTTLLIGDLAFLHDLNSLTMLKGLKNPIVIVVLNNNGGGIFSFLPIHNIDQHFEQCFGTPHHLNFHAAADLFDLNYCLAQTLEEFVRTYTIALKGRTSTIIEVQTDRADNLKIHNQLQVLIKRKIQVLLNNNHTRSNHDKKYNAIRKTIKLDHSRKLRRYQIR